MMKKLIVALLCLTTGVTVSAQVADNFTDGNFTQNPAWQGDDSLFTVTSGQLRLKGSITSEAHLSTVHQLTDTVTWTFYTRFTLSPSTQNFSRFYLMSNQANLEGSLNGYYVQLGGVTGNTDSITLYKQNGTVHTRVIAGRPATVSKTSNTVRVKVTRDYLGNWQLYSDTTGGSNYVLEGSGTDNTFANSSYLGWYIRYSSGNNQGHYLDDVTANQPQYDTTRPKIDSIKQQGNRQVMIFFNEPVDSVAAVNPLNYWLSPLNANPTQVTWLNSTTVLTEFTPDFAPKQAYVLSVRGVKDVSGNAIDSLAYSFFNLVFEPHDILISEFFPDPTPVIGLPELEFVELYNNTSVEINLGGLTLTDGGTTATLPNVTLKPDSFMVVCAQTAVSSFAGYGKVVGVANFPSLNNSGDAITLSAPGGLVLQTLTYDLSWYTNAAKSNGGYTLELISPKQLCKQKFNYTASNAGSGGTPGAYNSVWTMSADTVAPKINSVLAKNDSTLWVSFDEYIDTLQLGGIVFSSNPALGIDALKALSGDSLEINLRTKLTNKTTYLLSLDGAKDCSGNYINQQKNYYHLVPEEAHSYDVLITEIMADPDPAVGLPAVEYVELHNRSSKPISLNGWKLADNTSNVTLPDYLLLPDSFVVVLSSAYTVLFNTPTLGVASFPSLSNDGENLTLYNPKGQVIHALAYTSQWINDALKRNGGYSLELIDINNPCGTTNWKGSTNITGGTPGRKNSVSGTNNDRLAPKLLRVYPIDPTHLEVIFNESMDSTSWNDLSSFRLEPARNVVAANGVAPFYTRTILTLDAPLGFDTVYAFTVDSAKDCAQQLIGDERNWAVALGYKPDSGDLVLNEVLFNPSTSGVDYVELYNHSNKHLDLKSLLVAKKDDTGVISQFYEIAPQGFILAPKSFCVLTTNPAVVMQQYYCQYPENMITCNLPSLNDDAGNVLIARLNGEVLDEWYYTNKMHISLLDDENGVSLERIDYLRPTQDVTNWTSAAASVGYGTPTYKNSQYLQTQVGHQTVQLQPNTISPDGDGYQDVMNIHLSMNQTGYTGTVTIYNSAGVAVKHLFKNRLLGTQDTYTWDGTLDDGSKAPIGIYVFYVEAFNLSGEVKSFKVVGVVAGRL